jgi:hypothetical protein
MDLPVELWTVACLMKSRSLQGNIGPRALLCGVLRQHWIIEHGKLETAPSSTTTLRHRGHVC